MSKKYVVIRFDDRDVICSYERLDLKKKGIYLINARPVIGTFPTDDELESFHIMQHYYPRSNDDGSYNLLMSYFYDDVAGDDIFISEEVDNDDSLKLLYELNELEDYYLKKIIKFEEV